MTTREMLRVIAYDIGSDKARAKVADRLEEVAVRVQYSVFEARLSHKEARALMARLRPFLAKGDSLRLYTIPDTAITHCRVQGGPPIAEREDYWLL